MIRKLSLMGFIIAFNLAGFGYNMIYYGDQRAFWAVTASAAGLTLSFVMAFLTLKATAESESRRLMEVMRAINFLRSEDDGVVFSGRTWTCGTGGYLIKPSG